MTVQNITCSKLSFIRKHFTENIKKIMETSETLNVVKLLNVCRALNQTIKIKNITFTLEKCCQKLEKLEIK